MHDYFEGLGFRDVVNYEMTPDAGSDGKGGDPVLVQVQDGNAKNNAMWKSERDGKSPTLVSLCLWGFWELRADGGGCSHSEWRTGLAGMPLSMLRSLFMSIRMVSRMSLV